MNRFVGSIVRRVSRMVRTFEDISDRLFWNFLPLALRIVVTVVMLAILKPLLGAIVMVWIVIYLVASYTFALYKLRFDVKAAAVDSGHGLLGRHQPTMQTSNCSPPRV